MWRPEGHLLSFGVPLIVLLIGVLLIDPLQNGLSTSGGAVSHSGSTVHRHHEGNENSEKAANSEQLMSAAA